MSAIQQRGVFLVVLGLLLPVAAAHVEGGGSSEDLGLGGSYDILVEKRPGHPLVNEPATVYIETDFEGQVEYDLHAHSPEIYRRDRRERMLHQDRESDVILEGVAEKTHDGYRITHTFDEPGSYEMHITFEEDWGTVGTRTVSLHIEPQGPSAVFWAYVLLFILSPVALIKLKD